MSYALGIDVGTTYTAAAVVRDGRAEVATLGYRATSVPTVVLLTADGRFLVGDAAERRAAAEPGRAAREFKRRVGDPTPLLLGGTPVPVDRCLAEVIRWVVATVSEAEGGPPVAVTVTHPANWREFKRDVLREALRMVDAPDPGLLPEPVAAATWYARAERLAPGRTVAVYDLGGGTFDTTVLRRGADGRFETLGRAEGIERLGGVDVDEAVFGHVRRAVEAEGVDLAGRADDPATVAALAQLRRACVDAKESLSSETSVPIPVWLPGVHRDILMNRAELGSLIEPLLRPTVDALARVVASAGIRPRDLDAVLLVGGSSRIPLIAQQVAAGLGRPVAVDAHPKHPVALGAALDADAAHRVATAGSAIAGSAAAGSAAAGSATVAGALTAPAASGPHGASPSAGSSGSPGASSAPGASGSPGASPATGAPGAAGLAAPGEAAGGSPGSPVAGGPGGTAPAPGGVPPGPHGIQGVQAPARPARVPAPGASSGGWPVPPAAERWRRANRRGLLAFGLVVVLLVPLVVASVILQERETPGSVGAAAGEGVERPSPDPAGGGSSVTVPTGGAPDLPPGGPPSVPTDRGNDGDGDADGTSSIPVDLLMVDASPALNALARIYETTPRAREVVLYPDFAVAQVQVPGEPTYVDEYTWRDGQVTGPEPLQLLDMEVEDLEADLFSVSEIDPVVIPAVTQQTLRDCIGDRLEVTHVMISRDIVFDPQQRVLISVYASHPVRGGGGYVTFTLDGAVAESNCT